MSVQDLKLALSELDDDAEVCVRDFDTNVWGIGEIVANDNRMIMLHLTEAGDSINK